MRLISVRRTIGGGSIYKVGGPDAERRRCQRDGGRSDRRGQKPLSTFHLEVVNFVYFGNILTNLCFQVRQNVPDKNYGLGVSVNDAELVACCAKIITIQYSQAMIENLVIYSP